MVSFADVENLKQQWTDKFVVVDKNAPELRRFVGLTGTVKTVNMSGRALVQFDGPVDIAWYDIDPSFLTVIDQPLPKKVEAKTEHAKPAATAKPAAAKPAAGGKSPLELAREQAAKAQGAKAAGGKSPLELAREQAAKALAAKAQASAPAAEAPASEAPVVEEAPAAEAPAPAKPVSTTDESGKPLSKIELARRQGAFKGNK